MKATVRTALLSALLMAASVCVALLLCEAALRVLGFSYPSFHQPDERLGLRLRPNAEGWFHSEGEAFVRINSAGYRDRERSVAKPAGTFRIVVLGDSMIEALQVDLEKTFAALLERRLNECGAFSGRKIEVLNLGVSSYGTAQQLLTFRYYGAAYSPDLVLAAFFAGNDVRNNSSVLEPDKVRPFFRLEGCTLVEDRSFAESAEFRRRTSILRSVLAQLRVLRVVQAAYFIKDGLEMRAVSLRTGPAGRVGEVGIDDAVYTEPQFSQWRDAWALTERLLAQLRDEVRASGATLMVISLSSGIQVHPDPAVRAEFVRARDIKDIFYPNHRIEKVAAQLGLRSILLGPSFLEAAERDRAYFHGFPNTRMGAGHWNEAGNLMAAEVVAARLCGKTQGLAQGK
jgi:hypothetical protein